MYKISDRKSKYLVNTKVKNSIKILPSAENAGEVSDKFLKYDKNIA